MWGELLTVVIILLTQIWQPYRYHQLFHWLLSHKHFRKSDNFRKTSLMFCLETEIKLTSTLKNIILQDTGWIKGCLLSVNLFYWLLNHLLRNGHIFLRLLLNLSLFEWNYIRGLWGFQLTNNFTTVIFIVLKVTLMTEYCSVFILKLH